MNLGEVVQVIRKRARVDDDTLDEVIVRAVNLACEEIATLRPWWFLLGQRTGTTDSSGQLSFSTIGYPSLPLSEYGVVWGTNKVRLVPGKYEDSLYVTGTTPQVWWVSSTGWDLVLNIAPPGAHSIVIEGYWMPPTFDPLGWKDSDTNHLLKYVPGLVITRAWIEVAHYLGRVNLLDAHNIWIQHIQNFVGIGQEVSRRRE